MRIFKKEINITPKAKRTIYIILGILLATIIGTMIWVGLSAAHALDNITNGNFSLKQIFEKTELDNDNGRTNILLLGNGGSNHPGGQLTDTNIILSYDANTNQAAMISFPRDLYVDIADGGGEGRLNEAYAYGETNKEKTGGGGQVAMDTISEISGVPIHYYAEVDFVGLKELVDALGGVSVNVETAINDPYYPKDYFDEEGNYYKTDAYNPFYLDAGVQELDGVTALKYARSRETTSDFDRAGRQQKLLMAIRDKALSLGILSNPTKVVEIIDILGEHMKTDMDVTELKALMSIAKGLDMDSIIREVVDNGESGLLQSTTSSAGAYILLPVGGSFSAIQEMIQNIFSDGSDSSSSSSDGEGEVAGAQTSAYGEGTVEIYNGTGVSGVARKLAPELREKGLTVESLKTSSEVRDNTVLYDYTSGYDTASVKAIKELVPCAEVISRSDGPDNLDFKLILGQDYIK